MGFETSITSSILLPGTCGIIISFPPKSLVSTCSPLPPYPETPALLTFYSLSPSLAFSRMSYGRGDTVYSHLRSPALFLFKYIWNNYLFFLSLKFFYFILEFSPLTNNVVIVRYNSLGTQPYTYMHPFSPQTPLPSRLPHNIEQSPQHLWRLPFTQVAVS